MSTMHEPERGVSVHEMPFAPVKLAGEWKLQESGRFGACGSGPARVGGALRARGWGFASGENFTFQVEVRPPQRWEGS